MSITHSSTSSGVAGLKTRPALQPSPRISCSVRSTCALASGWKLTRSAPAAAKACGQRVDRLHHQVHVDAAPSVCATQTPAQTIGPMVRFGT